MKVIINGAGGRMGIELAKLVEEGYKGSSLAGLVDVIFKDEDCVKTYSSLNNVKEKADVLIDFSIHTATKTLCDYAVKENIPLVIATTGHTEEEIDIINETAKKVPIFMSGNMSMGIALLMELAKKVASSMPDADVEIVETHHNRKLDSPSGTALMLANAVKEVRPDANIVRG
ncbi:MAG: 4-hydroxy-tetrahydrodipicolinate reductase, partial [Clostridiales bacterium]|nr:4-hydroxy-tetrahydrodipicolinate reductase [Clostridiales bacterium]